MKVALVAGFWGQNIGNAFFNLGGEAALRQAGHDVYLVQDQPAYWTFRNESKGSYERRWSVVANLDVDLLVLQGPLFTRNFDRIWLEDLVALRDRGVQWAVISGAFRSYTEDEVAALRRVAAVAPPRLIVTRDDVSARLLRHAGFSVVSGIDSAFYLPKAVTPAPLETGEPYITLNFDHYVEPIINSPGPIELAPGASIGVSFGRSLNALSRRSKAHAYIAQLIDRRRVPERAAGHLIIRPEHRTNPHLPVKIYARPNAVASDEPWTYLSLYAHTRVTISDRVHACVATLAYGNRAMLYNPTTRRSALFEAAGVPRIAEEPVRLDLSLVERRWQELLHTLASLN